ncbi:hypothetical protein [Mesorhizobium sp. B2-6-5]|uniref:hypothetical protein n=1 Tax=Mesorhizobium sp. B2-6-5 TaxID=2589912 RepID=UPI001126F4C4|nr:hypothetical protein [Mesorhizobium sp. B2-6-5]TPJ32728.1 hypothetical protein FJ432_32000 [Mesorhizobium sp. B2-6-5]
MSNETFLLVPRWFGPAFYDSIIGAYRKAGFEPVIGEVAPVIGSVVVLVGYRLRGSRIDRSRLAPRSTRWLCASAPRDIAGRAQFRRANTRMSRIPELNIYIRQCHRTATAGCP